jgi:hypothetical protein
MDKSFLFLFFKKEILSSLTASRFLTWPTLLFVSNILAELTARSRGGVPGTEG